MVSEHEHGQGKFRNFRKNIQPRKAGQTQGVSDADKMPSFAEFLKFKYPNLKN